MAACPKCGGAMHTVNPKKNQTWKPFLGCDNYPECDGALRIKASGKPESIQEWQRREQIYEDWAAASFDAIHHRE